MLAGSLRLFVGGGMCLRSCFRPRVTARAENAILYIQVCSMPCICFSRAPFCGRASFISRSYRSISRRRKLPCRNHCKDDQDPQVRFSQHLIQRTTLYKIGHLPCPCSRRLALPPRSAASSCRIQSFTQVCFTPVSSLSLNTNLVAEGNVVKREEVWQISTKWATTMRAAALNRQSRFASWSKSPSAVLNCSSRSVSSPRGVSCTQVLVRRLWSGWSQMKRRLAAFFFLIDGAEIVSKIAG